jgi:hypothetical protein
MPQPKVVSREYKIMLRPGRFTGDERKLLRTATAFWRDFARSVAPVIRSAEGRLSEIKSRRLIRFFDTAGRHLNESSYVFRERRDASGDEREVTLKFRHPDRNVARDRRMAPRNPTGARTKFEEDIKTPFVSLYSFSTTVPIGVNRRLDVLEDVARLFPDVAGRLAGFRRDLALAVVNGFTAHELVICGASLQLRQGARGAAECALIAWYGQGRRQDRPVAVEFSYRYGNKKEKYDGDTSLRAFRVFEILQTRLGRWVDPKSRTKTAFVYG